MTDPQVPDGTYQQTLYCTGEDILIDPAYMPLPSGTTAAPYISAASSYIDAKLRATYLMPIRFPPDADAERIAEDKQILSTICRYLASGQMVLALTAGTENIRLHAYGRWLVEQGEIILKQLLSGDIELAAAERKPYSDDTIAGPLIGQGQRESLVDAYYQNFETYGFTPGRMKPSDDGDWPFDLGQAPIGGAW